MVACGDREDFLQFLRLVPSRREGTRRKNCKRESCRGSASAQNRSGSQENAAPWLPDPLMRLCLHHLEGFVHRNLATALQNGAAFGHLGSRVQRIRLNNGVPAGHRPHGAVTDGSVARDAFGLTGKRIAPVDDVTAELAVPGPHACRTAACSASVSG